jgi:hypothetical protein
MAYESIAWLDDLIPPFFFVSLQCPGCNLLALLYMCIRIAYHISIVCLLTNFNVPLSDCQTLTDIRTILSLLLFFVRQLRLDDDLEIPEFTSTGAHCCSTSVASLSAPGRYIVLNIPYL